LEFFGLKNQTRGHVSCMSLNEPFPLLFKPNTILCISDYNYVVYIISIMKGDNNNSIKYDNKNSKPIIIIKNSNLRLSESSSSSSSINIADTVNKKDERLNL
jgi:hypothetical protein